MSSRAKRILVAATLAALGAFGVWYLGQPARPSQIANFHAAFDRSPGSGAKGFLPPPEGNVSARPAASRTTMDRPSTLYEQFKRATNLGAAYSEFSAMAMTNPEAQYFQAAIFLACSNYAGSTIGATELSLEKEKASPKRQAALNQLKSRCKDLPAEAFKSSPFDVMRQAALRGDVKAKAALFLVDNPKNQGDYAAAMRDAQALASTKDPVVLESLASYFDNRTSLLQWTIPGADAPVSGAEMAMAFRMAACDYGLDCSANSPEALAACARAGRCDYGDRRADIQNDMLTPNAFNRAQLVRNVIAQGLATHVWPDGFWSGSNGSRR